MVDKVLKEGQGLTFDLFLEEPAQEQQQEVDEQGNPIENMNPESIYPKYLLVPEVVREPRMHFFKVPRLGSYLCVKLEYDSCQNEAALDAAFKNFMEMQ
mmetsp:Transcript_14809/g.10712  ORF Transcript_14809/g.10712 Transcript_14809/m.10712 type:complete len:99 (-) Transcript_14809:1533-1829(-)